MFVDQVSIHVKSGAGGAGYISFRREKYVPKGGPDGGNGGNGGDVIIRADSQLHTLLDHRYRRIYAAADGVRGATSRKDGKWGKNEVVRVPCGTVIKTVETGEMLADMVTDGQQYLVAIGGKGGRGNAMFATPTQQTPRHAEPGMPGQELDLLLELKLIADVGLVGLPNAGKSTLISVITAARPKIADYPFTTLEPNLGIVRYRDHDGFTVADIPGLIEGAHKGKGLGMQFLRHIERTSVLLIMIECMSEDYWKVYEVLRNELASYSSELAAKPMLLAITKTDSADDEASARMDDFERELGHPLLRFSSISGEGMEHLLDALWPLIQEQRSGSALDLR